MKRKILFVVLAVCLLTGCGTKIPKLSNGDEALVELSDGTKYSANEVWEEVKESYALDVVLKKIDSKILEEKYKDKKDEIEEYVKGRETTLKANYPDKTELNNVLTQNGFNSLDQYLETTRLSYLQELATKDYAKNKVTNKEIKDYYKNKAKGDISCVHILVKPTDTSDQEDAKALEKAKQVVKDIDKEIKNGKKVEDVFASYKDKDGYTYEDLGYFNTGEMESSFEESAYELKKGKYNSTPVKTTYGYHIILKVDEKEKKSLDDLKDSIKDTLAEEKMENDSKISINAMIELRKANKVKFHDSKIESAYNKYINYLLNQKDQN